MVKGAERLLEAAGLDWETCLGQRRTLMSRRLIYVPFASACLIGLWLGVNLALALPIIRPNTNCDGTFTCADTVQPGYPNGTDCYATTGSGPNCGTTSPSNDCVIDGSQYGYFPCTGQLAVWDDVNHRWRLLGTPCVFYWPNCATVPH